MMKEARNAQDVHDLDQGAAPEIAQAPELGDQGVPLLLESEPVSVGQHRGGLYHIRPAPIKRSPTSRVGPESGSKAYALSQRVR